MKDTIIYLIRHAETIDENGIRNTGETQQEINEKEMNDILTMVAYKESIFTKIKNWFKWIFK